MFGPRFIFAASVLAVSSMVAGVVVRADEGKPIDIGLAANRSLDATEVFGTTSKSTNFLTLPKDLCIVPTYANTAGIGSEKTKLLTQQALEICPQAQSIAVSTVDAE
ncbi:hypothetical protein BDV93DRAFT_522485 [Ceratobasidium sp. AG-I]|nr:hypothetical protein BDV93DRAFT_522485 [Ceratobasidium sp. AG-I]